jgi:transposase
MVIRREITDAAWEQIEPLLPENGRKGGRWRDHRTVIDGILWKLRTGAPWRDLPERYGPWQTCFDRFNRWRRDGTWDRLLEHAQTKSDTVGEVEWEVRVDDTVVRAHQHAAGARKRVGKKTQKGTHLRPRRSARAKPGWAVYQDTSDLRWQGEATLGPPHARPEAR